MPPTAVAQSQTPSASLLRMSAAARLAGALAIVAALWGAVFWAMT